MNSCIILICYKINYNWVSFLEKFNHYDIYIIVDFQGKLPVHPKIKFIQIDNNICRNTGYTNLNLIINGLNGWDKAIYFASTILENYDYFWFIEDDIFFYDEKTLLDIDTQYKEVDLLSNKIYEETDLNNWHWSWITPINFELPYFQGMMCICRMSKKLLDNISTYIKENKTMFFLEAMFPTVCKKTNLKYESPIEFENVVWRKHFNKNDFNKTHFFHPLKNKKLHSVYRHFIRSKNI